MTGIIKLAENACPYEIKLALKEIEDGASVDSMRKKYNVTHFVLRTWAKKLGVPYRQHHSKEAIMNVLKELQEGKLTIPKLAKKRRLCVQTLRQWVERYKITNYKSPPQYHMDPEKRLRMIAMAQELRLDGVKLSVIIDTLHKELGSVNPSTVSKWIRGINCEFPWRKNLLTGWKRSKALDGYIKEIECTLQAS